MRRRDFLRYGLGSLGVATASSLFTQAGRAASCVDGPGPYGSLLAADANGLMLPAGFRSRVIAESGTTVAGTSFTWHDFPDGGAIFDSPGGYIYVSNSEFDVQPVPAAGAGSGGVSAIRFNHRGVIQDAYSICSGTRNNCSGGATPWGTWLSCEEVDNGQVYECDPTGTNPAVLRPALGTMKHEAAAVDPVERRIYMTQDSTVGRFYRFTPTTWGDLSSGLLEVSIVDSNRDVTWHTIPDPDPTPQETPLHLQVPYSLQNPDETLSRFNRGEGIVYNNGHVFIATTGDSKIHDYDVATQEIVEHYVAPTPGNKDSSQLTEPDGIAVSRSGDLFVAEDVGTQEIVLLDPQCVASAFLKLDLNIVTDITGPAFDPLGRRLYFSTLAGGTNGTGVTYEVEGPFRRVA